MGPVVLLILSVVLTVTKSSLYNLYGKKRELNAGTIFGYNAVVFAAGLAVIFFSDMKCTASGVTVLCAAAYAIDVFLLQSLSVLSMKLGSMSLTSTMVLYGMILPALAGPIFWKEEFGVLKIVGLVLMLVSIAFFAEKGERSAVNRKAVLLSVVCFFLSGTAGILEKIHQSTTGREEKSGFLLIAYAMMLLFSLVCFFATAARGEKKKSLCGALFIGGISGIVYGVCCRVNLTLAGTLDSLIYYPVSNGGALLLTLFVSVLFFGEKFSIRRTVGFVLGLCAIVALSLPL